MEGGYRGLAEEGGKAKIRYDKITNQLTFLKPLLCWLSCLYFVVAVLVYPRNIMHQILTLIKIKKTYNY